MWPNALYLEAEELWLFFQGASINLAALFGGMGWMDGMRGPWIRMYNPMVCSALHLLCLARHRKRLMNCAVVVASILRIWHFCVQVLCLFVNGYSDVFGKLWLFHLIERFGGILLEATIELCCVNRYGINTM